MRKALYIGLIFLLGACSSSKNLESSQTKLTEDQQLELKAEFLRANKEKILGNNEAALRLFRRCLFLDPNHAASLYEAGRLEYYIGHSIVAINHLEQAVEIDPQNKWYKLELADMYANSGQFKKAANVYQKLSEQYPYNLEWKHQMALMHMASGQLKDAMEVYDQIEEMFVVSEEVSIQKQKIYLEQNDTKAAIAEMEKLISTFPGESKYLAILAELHKKNGDEKMAIETFKRLEKQNPNNPYVQLSLSEYYSDLQDSKQSYDYLKKAFLNPELDIDTKIRYLLKYYALSGADPSLQGQAQELNQIVIETHPDDPKSYAMMGDFLYREKKLEEARVSYEKALELDQNRYAIWNQLILIDSELEDFPKVIEDSRKAIDLFPNQPLFYYFKSIGHVQLKEYPDAIENLNTGLPMAILNKDMAIQFHSSLGDCYHFVKNYEMSDQNYDVALELDGDNFYVLNNYSYFLSLRKEKLDQAFKMAKKCVSADPNSATYLDTFAWVLYQQGKYDQAAENLEKALQSGGEFSGEILEHYGDTQFRLGNLEKAKEYWVKAKDKGQSSEELDKKISTGSIE